MLIIYSASGTFEISSLMTIFIVRDRNGAIYFIYFDIENQVFEIDNYKSFLSELESFFL